MQNIPLPKTLKSLGNILPLLFTMKQEGSKFSSRIHGQYSQTSTPKQKANDSPLLKKKNCPSLLGHHHWCYYSCFHVACSGPLLLLFLCICWSSSAAFVVRLKRVQGKTLEQRRGGIANCVTQPEAPRGIQPKHLERLHSCIWAGSVSVGRLLSRRRLLALFVLPQILPTH